MRLIGQWLRVKMFRRKQTKTEHRVTSPPNGSFLFDGEDTWLVKSGKLYQLHSARAADSWSANPIKIPAGWVNTMGLTIAGTVGFRDGSLIKDIVSGKIYLVSDSRTRLVVSPNVLDILGRDRIIEVGPDEVGIHKEGEDIHDI
jgi:hypothetical protein